MRAGIHDGRDDGAGLAAGERERRASAVPPRFRFHAKRNFSNDIAAITLSRAADITADCRRHDMGPEFLLVSPTAYLDDICA